MYAISFMTIDNYFSHCSVLKEEKKTYCHMVYYIKNWEAIFDAFKKIRQIDGNYVKSAKDCVLGQKFHSQKSSQTNK